MGAGSTAGIDFGGGATHPKSYPSQPQLPLSQTGAGPVQLLYIRLSLGQKQTNSYTLGTRKAAN